MKLTRQMDRKNLKFYQQEYCGEYISCFAIGEQKRVLCNPFLGNGETRSRGNEYASNNTVTVGNCVFYSVRAKGI
jgi:hypothetical protein